MMKNHNSVIIAKAFFVLGLLACFAGCSDPFFDKSAEAEIPTGKGTVRWSVETEIRRTIETGISRTIFPEVPFSRFELTFTTAGRETVTETFTASAGELMLEAGRWELSVLAYIGADPEPAAQGSAPVTVLGGRINDVTVTLRGIAVSGTGTGDLAYDVTLPSGLLYGEISVMALDGTYSTKASLMAASTGSIPSIPDGYYILAFYFFRTAERAVITEIAHIYNGLTIDAVYDLSAAPFASAPEISVPSGGAVVLINSAAELAAIAGDITKSAKNNGKNAYILGDDIDLSSYSPWTPLGDQSASFMGYLFGDGHTMRGLELPGGSGGYIGLFGYTQNARIENLQVEIPDTNITLTGSSGQHVGIAAGRAYDTAFNNLQVRVVSGGSLVLTKAAGNLYTGSIAGNLASGSRIERCGFVGNITVLSGGTTSVTGGLAGYTDYGEICESYMVGLITHINNTAGAYVETSGLIIGGTVEDCYYNGTIRASGASSAFIGIAGLGSSGSRSYAAGSIVNNGSNGYAAGLFRYYGDNSAALNLAVSGVSAKRVGAENADPYTNNYALNIMVVNGFVLADAAVNPQNDVNGLGKTAAELQAQSTYESGLGWDFDDVWEMGPPEYPYPILKWQKGQVDLPDGYGLTEFPENFIFEFTSLNDTTDTLATLSQNSVLNPYQVKLSGFDISVDFAAYAVYENDPLGALFATLSGKYVKLDLSACTGTSIPSMEYPSTIDTRPNKAMPVSILLPSTLTSIGRRVFGSCSSIKSITIPDSVTEIGVNAFANCTSLESVDLPSGLTVLSGFGGTALVSIDIPSSVTSIGASTFSNCTSLASIDLPSGVTAIGSYAFSGCTSLVSIDLPSGVTAIGDYAFRNCTNLASITIPAGVTSINYYAFYGCTSLVSIDLPSGVTAIGNYAFRDCTKLASITIPAGVTSIDSYAFSGCTSLTSIVCLAATPPPMVFGYAQTIRVPATSVDTYKAAAGWSAYAAKIQAIQ
jgi:hypothetical protein